MSVDRWQYLIVLGACLLITAPLELFGRGVYRQSRRAAAAVLPVAVVFLIWDAIASSACSGLVTCRWRSCCSSW